MYFVFSVSLSAELYIHLIKLLVCSTECYSFYEQKEWKIMQSDYQDTLVSFVAIERECITWFRQDMNFDIWKKRGTLEN